MAFSPGSGTVTFTDLELDAILTHDTDTEPSPNGRPSWTVTLEDEDEVAQALRSGIMTEAQGRVVRRAKHVLVSSPDVVARVTNDAVAAVLRSRG